MKFAFSVTFKRSQSHCIRFKRSEAFPLLRPISTFHKCTHERFINSMFLCINLERTKYRYGTNIVIEQSSLEINLVGKKYTSVCTS